jgi:hypothetical protein
MSAQTLRGHLLDAAHDLPIDLGLIIMRTESGDSVTYAVSDERGYFSVTSPDPGSFHLLAWALGYGETQAGVFDLGMGGELTVEFRMAAEPLPVAPILVGLDRPVLEHALVRNGFLRRYQRRGGGHFLTPHDIETSPATTTEDLFVGLAGLTLRPQGQLSYLGDRVLMRSPAGAWCEPSLFVDGTRVRHDVERGRSLSSVVPLADVAAVEVYRGPAEVPSEYNVTRSRRDASSGVCGIIVLWTRQGR